jgi:hypothetical protein
MIRIYKDNKTIKYVDDNKDIVAYTPKNDTILSVKFTTNGRKILYKDGGWYFIEKTNKKKGVYAGDICQVCVAGECVDFGGCATCNNCGSQLKCGL